MLIGKNILLNSAKAREQEPQIQLPDGYVKVKYLEKRSSGVYIDMGFKISGKYQVQMYAQFPSTIEDDTWFLGTWNNSRCYLIGYYQKIHTAVGADNSTRYSTQIPFDNEPHLLGFMKDRFITDDLPQTTYPDFDTLPTNGSYQNVVLFKSWHVDNSRYRRIYWCKIWDWNDNLVRDLVACKDASGKPCMYDDVQKKTYYPTSGSLYAGPVGPYTGAVTDFRK